MTEYEAVIGLEIHAQLATKTKLFCGCDASYGGTPNTRVCPVCLALPGALPVVNETAISYAVLMGLATHCRITPLSTFARKNYFYPDCPKNYQITQYDSPLCENGYIGTVDGNVRIRRIHLEEDAGKLVHSTENDESYVDLNRCGVPLIEIVSEPDIRSPAQAREFMQKLRTVLRYLGVCDGNMEEGSLRCDANVSVRAAGSGELGVKTEIKNVNSFKFIEQALTYEIERQCAVRRAGGEVTPDTLLWDARRGEARVMRAKEEAYDYRYFPEPDLSPLRVTESLIDRLSRSLPELPDEKKRRFVGRYGLGEHDADVLVSSRELADYFEAVAGATRDAKVACNWVMGEVLRALKERSADVADLRVPPSELAALISIVSDGRINTTTAKDVFKEMAATGRRAIEIVDGQHLDRITDADTIGEEAKKVIEAYPDAMEKYLRGEDKVLKYFVGRVMAATEGRVDPRMAESILKTLLDERRRGRP